VKVVEGGGDLSAYKVLELTDYELHVGGDQK
jgi:hypothetical protein